MTARFCVMPILVWQDGVKKDLRVNANGDQRAILLIPCGKGEEGCQSAAEGMMAAPQIPLVGLEPSQGHSMSSDTISAWRTQLARRYHLRGLLGKRD